MKPIDETNEKIEDIDIEKEEKIGDKTIDSSDDLIQEKRRANEFNAEGNIAQYQIFVQNLSNLNAFVPNTKTMDMDSSLRTTHNLCELEECIKFIEKYKDGEFLAIAIILSVFEAVPLRDLPDLKSGLMEYMPSAEILEKEGVETHSSQLNPYISLNSIIAVIGGKRFVIGNDQQYVGLGEDSKQALLNIWEQFPDLRNSIILWLIHINKIHEYRTTFDVYQMAMAFARVISLDFIDARKRIFPQLYLNKNNVGLLGILAYKLYENVKLREEMNILLKEWMKSDRNWLWRSASFTYLYFIDNDINFPLETSLKRAILRRFLYFNKSDLRFLAILMFRAKQFRFMCADIFGNAYSKADSQEKKITIANIYIELIRRSYYLVNKTFIELPLVCFDTREQHSCLLPVIKQVMSNYPLRKQLYIILEAYLKELSNYKFSTKVVNHMSAYLYGMALNGLEYQQDIISFLKGCQCKMANQIYDRLLHLFKQRIGEYE